MDGNELHLDKIYGSELREVGLQDKYDLNKSTVFVSGTQALVRLCLLQAEKDTKAGLNTAGYVTGYRGSPLGGIDLQFSQAEQALTQAGVTFHPGLNEDLAATAVWGTQQINLHGEGDKDGVFAIWYGKGPGVDRTGDVFRHGNLAGSSTYGGVLVLMGDDHAGESSTVCHQSEYAMMDAMIPVLNPANLAEMVDFGLQGWAMSRFAGVWVGIKCVKDNIESTASVRLTADDFHSHLPNDYTLPSGGLNIRRHDDRFTQEQRLHSQKMAAAKAFARANRLDRITVDGGTAPRFGIVSTGKAYMDVMQALADLGIDAGMAKCLGLSVYKVGMSWPLDPEGITEFATPLHKMLVVEEKRGLIEPQIKDCLYGQKGAPVIIGKRDLTGGRLLPEEGSINATQVARIIAEQLLDSNKLNRSVSRNLDRIRAQLNRSIEDLSAARVPYFCAGCPHNSSTVLPEGARGYAGIGCHWMAQFMDRNVEGNTHMGGEGANWIGEACFSTRRHVFQNIGDGTFNHSGVMAVRAAVAADVNITYKVLYNDAVAMTGGQTHEGGMTPVEIAKLLDGCGVRELALVTDDLSRHDKSVYPAGISFHHRTELQLVQQRLEQIEGVTGLIYDQTCATEKRRRRKRGQMPDPNQRIFINPEVCEGCGDCGEQSNCVAILPLETELGRKRKIDQSACNKDFSCVKGFCPSFVTVSGGTLRKPEAAAAVKEKLPLPEPAFSFDAPVSYLLTGVGGTGVVTIAALIGMAAHIEGKGCGIIDMAGLAQKGGAVTSHIRLAPRPEDISAIRIGPGGADVMLGCDMLVSADSALLKLMSQSGHVVANTNEMPTGGFTRDTEERLPVPEMANRLHGIVAEGQATLIDTSRMAVRLLGDSIASNLLLLGVAWQKGLIPLSSDAIEKAIALNGIAIQQSINAFRWGRKWVLEAEDVEKAVTAAEVRSGLGAVRPLALLDEIISDRMVRLTRYQNGAYASRYREKLDTIIAADTDPDQHLSKAAARYLFKMMAIKDEYEVARLYTDGRFANSLSAQFEGNFAVSYHLSPPLLSRTDPVTGRPKKSLYGSWVKPVMSILARCKGVRGTVFDLFGYTAERKAERAALARYEAVLDDVAIRLKSGNYSAAVRLVSVPEYIRGFGPVRHVHLVAADKKYAAAQAEFDKAVNAGGPDKELRKHSA